MNKNMRNTAILLVVFLAVYMFGNYFAEKSLMSGGRSSSYSYERFESDIAKNKVKSVEVVQNAQVPTGSAIVKLSDGEKKVVHVTDVNKVIELAQQYKVTCHVDDVKSSDAGWLSMILPWIVIGVILMFMFAMMSRASGGGGGGNKMMNFGKSRAKMQDPGTQNIRFDQVAGLQEEKEELKEIVLSRQVARKARKANNTKTVAFVGYTNAGKSSTINTLLSYFDKDSDKQVFVKNMFKNGSYTPGYLHKHFRYILFAFYILVFFISFLIILSYNYFFISIIKVIVYKIIHVCIRIIRLFFKI